MTDVVNQGMEILEQVSQKVNVDGTNLNTEGKTLITSYSFPSNKYVDFVSDKDFLIAVKKVVEYYKK